jgi:SAM-dependent methyltransferase
MKNQLNYGNWIRKKLLFILGICTLVTFVLIFLPFGPIYRVLMTCLFVFTGVSFFFPLYSYFMFSQNGGKFQEKVYDSIIKNLGSPIKGKILDIGSGNGVLSVLLAQEYPDAEVYGLDYWGKDWEYSKNVCDSNARVGEVDGRVHFQKGDAAKLEFADDTFDAAVSNLTFHEVRSAKDKRVVVREALRVIKHGGSFTFVDYFYDPKLYGHSTDFKAYLQDLKLSQFEFRPLREVIAIPAVLQHPKIFGKVGIIFGKK